MGDLVAQMASAKNASPPLLAAYWPPVVEGTAAVLGVVVGALLQRFLSVIT